MDEIDNANFLIDCKKDKRNYNRQQLREKEKQKSEMLSRVWKYKYRKEQEMSEEKKEYAKGIYIKKLEGKYGEWLSVSIKKADGSYDNYKFYPKKEQKSDKYTEFYGVFDNNFKSEKKEEESSLTNANDIIIGEDEVPF